MRMMALAVAIGLAIPSVALAQKATEAKPDVKKAPTVGELDSRLTKLEGDVGQLMKLGAEVPSLGQAVSEIQAQLGALRQDVDALKREHGGSPEVAERLDGIDARLGKLADDVAALRAQIGDRNSPEAHAMGGGVGSYDDGFVLRAGDGDFTIRTKAYLQPRLLVRTDEVADTITEDGFSLRRAIIGWDGIAWSPKLTYKIQVDFGQGKTQLLDAWFEGKLRHHLTLRAGQFRVPFSSSFLIPEDRLSFVERPLAVEEFRYDRDLGMSLAWEPHGTKKFRASASVFNGAGKNVAKNDNLDLLFVGRVGGTVLGDPWQPEEGDFDGVSKPGLQLGGAVSFENAPEPLTFGYGKMPPKITNTDVDGDGKPDNVQVVQLEGDAAFRFKGFGAEAEGFYRHEDWGTILTAQPMTAGAFPSQSKFSYLGIAVQASYFVIPGRMLVGARGSFAQISPLLLGGRTIGAPPESNSRHEWSLLCAYYRHRHGLSLSAMYSFFDWGGAAADKGVGENRLIVQGQVAF